MITQRVFDPNAVPVIMVAASRARPGRIESLLSWMRNLKKGSTRLKMFRRDANETVKALSSLVPVRRRVARADVGRLVAGSVLLRSERGGRNRRLLGHAFCGFGMMSRGLREGRDAGRRSLALRFLPLLD